MSSLSSLVFIPRLRAGRMGLGELREERRATTQTGIGVQKGSRGRGVRNGALPLGL